MSVAGPKLQKREFVVVNNHPDGGSDWESDEEPDYNRIGNVPLKWYEGEEHIGYDITGEKVAQTLGVKESEIDRLIANADNPDAWRTIVDLKNQKTTVLSAADLEIIRRIREGKLGVRPVEEIDFEFPWDQGHMPLVSKGLRKAHFVPSRHEEKKIQHFIRLIRTGKLYTPPPPEPDVFDIWGENVVRAADDKAQTYRHKLQAPKLPNPGHAESYNPPTEYLWSNEEIETWKQQHPDDREQDFIPQKFGCLRHVPGFEDLLLQRFKRCLDLYLCPRTVRKLNVTSLEEILPAVPPLENFYPFPSRHGFTLKESGSPVTSVTISSDQSLLLAGCQDGSVSMHNLGQRPYTLPLFYFKSTSRATAFAIKGASFHPRLNVVAFGRSGYLFVCLLRDSKLEVEECSDLLSKYWQGSSEANETAMDIKSRHRRFFESIKLMSFSTKEIPKISNQNRPKTISGNRNWRSFKSKVFFKGLRDVDEDEDIQTDLEETEDVGHEELHSKDWEECNKLVELMSQSKWVVSGYVVRLGGAASSVDFHKKGIYIATTCPNAANKSNQILLHSLKKRMTLRSFKEAIKSDRIRSARFHPTEPWMCLGLDKSTRIYSLVPDKNQESAGKDTGGKVQEFHGTNAAGDLAVHGNGKNYIRVTDDGKLVWYDAELGSNPYKILKLTKENTASLTTLNLHHSKPLLAVGTSEGYVQIVHASIDPESFLEDVEIVPLVRLKDNKSSVRSLSWFPNKHWLATGHSDGKLMIWI